MRQAGKAAIVTGAGKGIGRAVALRLANEGADVAVVGLTEGPVAATSREVQGLGRRALALSVDVSNSSRVAEMADIVLRDLGRIDYLINSAAVMVTAPMVETTEADWDRIMAVNAKGTFLCCKEVVPHMVAQRSGRIVNFFSSGARYGSPNSTAYAATKFAVWGFTLSLAVELAPFGINVNCVSPGVTATDMMARLFEAKAALVRRPVDDVIADVTSQLPPGRMASPEDIAGAVAFLVSADADYVTGHVLQVDGANSRLHFQ